MGTAEPKRNEVTAILRKIMALAKPMGLTLHKYRSKSITSFLYNTTYVLHNSKQRPAHQDECSGPMVKFTGREGSTASCKAYIKLTELLKELEANIWTALRGKK